jgi:tetratricopeptide (TPR) repeat protein
MADDKKYLQAIARGIEACKASDHSTAESLFTNALAECERVNGQDHLDTAVCLDHLASVLTLQSRYAEAEARYRRSAEIRAKRCPEIVNQAIQLQREGRTADAELLFRDALTIYERADGPEHRNTATCLDNLATACRIQSKFDEALPLCQRALLIREKECGREHRETAASYSNLGWLHRRMGNIPEAERMLDEALRIREKIFGSEHPDTAESCDRLAALKKDQGKLEKNQAKLAEAESLCKRALAIRQKTLGPDHCLTAASLNNLGTVYRTSADAENRTTPALDDPDFPGFTAAPATAPAPERDGAADTTVKTVRSPFSWAIEALSVLWGGYSEQVGSDHWSVRSVTDAIETVAPEVAPRLHGRTSGRAHWLVEACLLVSIVVAFAFVWWIGWKIVWLALQALLPWIGVLTVIGLCLSVWYVVVFLNRVSPYAHDEAEETPHSLYDGVVDRVRAARGTLEAKMITVDQAKAMARQSIVHLNGLTSLSRDVARALAKQNGLLSLNALTTLSDEAAAELSHHCGSLFLDGVTELSEAAAASLKQHRGRVSLRGLADDATPLP